MSREIVTIDTKGGLKFLRRTTAEITSKTFDSGMFRKLIKEMKEIMRGAEGVGLSANQIGLNLRLFVAEIPASSQGGRKKFYAIINPKIIKVFKETAVLEEGCLSVPGRFGSLERPDKIIAIGLNPSGKKIKIKAWGFLARVFQHEIDHLNGILFTDKTKSIQKISKTEATWKK